MYNRGMEPLRIELSYARPKKGAIILVGIGVALMVKYIDKLDKKVYKLKKRVEVLEESLKNDEEQLDKDILEEDFLK